jgi:transcriptional regulator with PAS, ATPase and Fis domain
LLESLLILKQPGVIGVGMLPGQFRSGGAGAGGAGINLEAAEKGEIEKALKQAGGDRARAAQLLNVSLRTLYRKMARYGLR